MGRRSFATVVVAVVDGILVLIAMYFVVVAFVVAVSVNKRSNSDRSRGDNKQDTTSFDTSNRLIDFRSPSKPVSNSSLGWMAEWIDEATMLASLDQAQAQAQAGHRWC